MPRYASCRPDGTITALSVFLAKKKKKKDFECLETYVNKLNPINTSGTL